MTSGIALITMQMTEARFDASRDTGDANCVCMSFGHAKYALETGFASVCRKDNHVTNTDRCLD